MIDSRKVDDLHPKVAEMCRAFISACDKAGYPVVITSTYRDAEFQNSLYAKGRTTAGAIVTKAKGGQSMHNWQVAFDFVPIDSNGKAKWNDEAAFKACGKIAEGLGLEWGGSWKFRDMPHCQFTGGLTIADFQAGKTL